MSQAWGLCPKCGKAIPLEAVDFPKQPAELLRHQEEHFGATTPPKPGETVGTSSPAHSPSTLDAYPPHGAPRAVSSRPHGRPTRRSAA